MSTWLLVIAVGGLVLSCNRRSAEDGSKTAYAEAGEHPVTTVAGPSWLKHLGLRVPQSRMGEMGGTAPAPPTPRHEPELTQGITSDLSSVMRRYLSVFRSNPQQATQTLNEPFMLAGEDLYRLSCQSCHGTDGKGAPPEVNSLIDPVEGTSTVLIKTRMGARGTPISDEFARQLAAEAEKTLRDRLQNGGKKMPPFRHLRGDEVDALIGYLQKLAGVPSPKDANLLVRESAARVGEHVIKGTCHICHDATGPGGGHMMMMQGIIPSLASLPQDHSLGSVERQVQYGSSGMMRMMMGGETMPALPYFTEEEIAAAYFYLVEYPPQP